MKKLQKSKKRKFMKTQIINNLNKNKKIKTIGQTETQFKGK